MGLMFRMSRSLLVNDGAVFSGGLGAANILSLIPGGSSPLINTSHCSRIRLGIHFLSWGRFLYPTAANTSSTFSWPLCWFCSVGG